VGLPLVRLRLRAMGRRVSDVRGARGAAVSDAGGAFVGAAAAVAKPAALADFAVETR
jgi:hypothetical protein